MKMLMRLSRSFSFKIFIRNLFAWRDWLGTYFFLKSQVCCFPFQALFIISRLDLTWLDLTWLLSLPVSGFVQKILTWIDLTGYFLFYLKLNLLWFPVADFIQEIRIWLDLTWLDLTGPDLTSDHVSLTSSLWFPVADFIQKILKGPDV